MSFGPSVTTLTAGQVDATTLIPLSKASARNEMQSQLFLAELLRLASTGNIILGGASAGTSGVGVVAIPNGTAPTTQPADEYQVYSADFDGTAGDARAHFWGEAGNPVAIGNNAVAIPKPAQAASTTAGRAITLKASDAVAGSTNAGAAAGGGVTVQAGDAKRLTSGNANGGDVVLLPGALVGSGTNGVVIVRQPGGTPGTDEIQVSHDGTNGYVLNKDGTLRLVGGSNFGAFAVGFARVVEGRDFDGTSWGSVPEWLMTTLDRGSWFGSTWVLAWTNTAGNANAARDAGITRAAAGVMKPTAGHVGNGWFQNTAGEGVLNAAFTRSDATLTSTNLSFTVAAGRHYRIDGVLQVSNTVAGEGVQFDFGGGTATATTFFVATDAVGSVVAGTVAATALNTALTYTTVTGTAYVRVRGYLKVNAAGTLVLRAAEATTSSGTVTLGAGSWLALSDSVAL